MLRPALRKLALAAAALLGGAGCSVASAGDANVADEAVRVQPRVVLDGLIELAQNSDGRIFVDEVVFHVPSVLLQDGHALSTTADPRGESRFAHGFDTPQQPRIVVDELAVDNVEGPLFFRYDVAAPEGTAALGSERRWLLPSTSDTTSLSFGFEPLEASRSELRELAAGAGYRLDALQGHTAYVHGYFSVDEPPGTQTVRGAVSGSTASGDASSGDPDGSPADAEDGTTESGGDPDGSPADDTDGTDESGDPDGSPADTSGTDESGGDPDGSPADSSGGDPDGSPADTSGTTESGGDPDGSPADTTGADGSGDPDGSPAEGEGTLEGSSQESTALGRPSTFRKNSSRLVPFYIVVNDAFSLAVPVKALPNVEDDAVLPIDLHLQTNSLFDPARLESLGKQAQSAASLQTTVFMELDATDAARVFEVQKGSLVQSVSSDGDGLKIIADPR